MGKQGRSMRFAEERVMGVMAKRRAGIQPGTVHQESDTRWQDDGTTGDTEAAHARSRKRKYSLEDDVKAIVKYQKSLKIETKLPVFGPRRFLTFEEFETLWAYYCAKHFACYRAGHTIKSGSANTKIEQEFARSMEDAAARGVDHSEPLMLIPSTLSHQVITYQCVHGYVNENGKKRKEDGNEDGNEDGMKGRGSGYRVHPNSTYFDCPAQIRAMAVYNVEKDRWEVVCDHENRTHNHSCDFESYVNHIKTANIKNEKPRSDLITMGPTVLSATARELHGDYYGGLSALDGFHGLMLRFTDFEGYLVLNPFVAAKNGNERVNIEDQDGVTIGIGLQTKMQREIFLEYGDNVILDWTHNTNNVGYYMGAFLVTTASGKGVSVFDMLCLTQSKDMMRAFFQHFANTNPGARERVRSFVIDKDYREWEVLEEVFYESGVVLCQFHVLKWFAFVVTQDKYAIPVSLHEEVLRSLRIMVYAASSEDFDHHQRVLKNLLAAKQHQTCLQYLHDRWYNCTRMWANCLRGQVFTACNTTSNRLESFWRRYKDDLAFRQRVDKCLEAIFLHATSVLTREKDEFVNHLTSVTLRDASVPFLEPLLRDLGEFTSPLVKLQWALYAGTPAGAYQIVSHKDVDSAEPTTYTVRMTAQRSFDFTVCMLSWTCTCHFFAEVNFPVVI